MDEIWTTGTDTVTAIAAFNGFLVVFGERHIVFWGDNKGSAIGLDPANLYVTDIIAGTGCINQQTIQNVGETDLIFLSSMGVQSLQRLIQEKSNPVTTLSKTVGFELSTNASIETQFRSAYHPIEGFYLLSMPNQGVTWVFDQRRRYIDEQGDLVSPVTRWDLAPTSWLSNTDGHLYLGHDFGIGKYTGNVDGGSTIRFIYHSPWLNLGEDYANLLKILKKMGFVMWAATSSTVVFKWYVDFDDAFKSATRTLTSAATAEWGEAEYAVAEWGGGLSLIILKIPARGKGQYFRIAVESEVSGQLAIQQAELFTKIGRLA